MPGLLITGGVIGSVIGPAVSRHISERGLRSGFSAVLFLIGLRYVGLL